MQDFSKMFNTSNFIDKEEYGDPLCAEVDPELFFPQENFYQDKDGKLVLQSSSYYDEAGAKSICRECPYRQACLVVALQNNEGGIWGGTTEGERKNLRRSMRRRGHDLNKINLYIKR